jgi:hypothetical protein
VVIVRADPVTPTAVVIVRPDPGTPTAVVVVVVVVVVVIVRYGSWRRPIAGCGC